MKTTIFSATAVTLILSTTMVNADSYNSSSGRPARDSDVRAKIVELENNISANANGIAANAAAIAAISVDQGYDYRNYSADPAITSKVFNLKNASGSCDTETRNFKRNTVGDTTTITRERIRTLGGPSGSPCQYVIHTMISNSTGYYLVSEESYNSNGTILNNTTTLDTPVIQRGIDMHMGKTTADASTSTSTSGNPVNGALVESTTVLGIESVTVPYGSYNDCLKVLTVRESNSMNTFSRISWFCPGVGFVKGTQGTGNSWELTNVIQ